MAQEIGKPFSTIRNWMKAFFPSVFQAMGGGGDEQGNPNPTGDYSRPDYGVMPTSATEMLENARKIAAAHAADAEANWRLRQAVEALLEELRMRPAREPEPEDF